MQSKLSAKALAKTPVAARSRSRREIAGDRAGQGTPIFIIKMLDTNLLNFTGASTGISRVLGSICGSFEALYFHFSRKNIEEVFVFWFWGRYFVFELCRFSRKQNVRIL